MKSLVCNSSVCSNESPMTDDPLKEWCNACYPKRVDKAGRNQRSLKHQIDLVNRCWRVPTWRPA